MLWVNGSGLNMLSGHTGHDNKMPVSLETIIHMVKMLISKLVPQFYLPDVK